MTPPLSAAQAAQQSNRDDRGRYAERLRAETTLTLTRSDSALVEARAAYGDFVTPHHVDLPEDVEALLDGLRAEGFNPLLVGGSVRDSFDGTTPKDLDFEIYGASSSQVEQVATRFGRVDVVGRRFGVAKTTLPSGIDLDLSVPRRENKVGVGHGGFEVEMDPTMTVADAAARRDYTVNAMSYDPRLGVLIDPYGGQADLEAGVLRHVSDAFGEDPQRVLRGMQFAARFKMQMHPETANLARTLLAEADALPVEGIRDEWAKWAEKGQRPSDGLRVLAETGWDSVHPGLADVLDSTTCVQVETARLMLASHADFQSRYDPRVVLGAVLMHRMSPADRAAFAHQTITGTKAQQHAIALAADDRPLPTTEAQARAQAHVGPSIRERVLMAAICRGASTETLRTAMNAAWRTGVTDGPEPDLITGDDVLADGGKPGRWVGALLGQARAAQVDGTFRDRDGALAWLAANR